jgi:hypothetical protein
LPTNPPQSKEPLSVFEDIILLSAMYTFGVIVFVFIGLTICLYSDRWHTKITPTPESEEIYQRLQCAYNNGYSFRNIVQPPITKPSFFRKKTKKTKKKTTIVHPETTTIETTDISFNIMDLDIKTQVPFTEELPPPPPPPPPTFRTIIPFQETNEN